MKPISNFFESLTTVLELNLKNVIEEYAISLVLLIVVRLNCVIYQHAEPKSIYSYSDSIQGHMYLSSDSFG